MHLKQLQQAFKNALKGESVDLIDRDPYLAARLELYKANQDVRLLRSLMRKYKMTAHYLGEPLFKESVHMYVAAHPLRSPFLCTYGAGFADYIETDLIQEIARMEWAMNETLLDFKHQPSLPSDLFLKKGAKIKLKEGIKLLTSRFDLKEVWKRPNIKEDVPQEKIWHCFLVASEKQQSFFMKISFQDYTFLSSLRTGVALEKIDQASAKEKLARFHDYCTMG